MEMKVVINDSIEKLRETLGKCGTCGHVQRYFVDCNEYPVQWSGCCNEKRSPNPLSEADYDCLFALNPNGLVSQMVDAKKHYSDSPKVKLLEKITADLQNGLRL